MVSPTIQSKVSSTSIQLQLVLRFCFPNPALKLLMHFQSGCTQRGCFELFADSPHKSLLAHARGELGLQLAGVDSLPSFSIERNGSKLFFLGMRV